MPIPHLQPKDSSWRVKQIKYSSSHRRRKTSYFPNKGPRKKFKIIKVIIIAFLILIFLGGLTFIGVFAWYSRDLPNPDRLLERFIPQSTKIYDRTGKIVLYEIHGEERRVLLDLEDLPEYVKWATIVIEDKNFYQHKGFSFKRMVKAAFIDLLKGKKLQGASTITQQFVKNAILSPKKTFSRKIKELILSYQIEKKFSKNQILKMYLNEIPYGSTAYGIEAASQTYFGKSAKQLTLAEAAVLAALPKAPTYYFNHKDKLIARQRYILHLLLKNGYITKEDYQKALKEKIVFSPKKEKIIAPHFVMYVKEILTERYGEKEVEQGGLNVYTTLDVEKQKIAEEIIKKQAEKNEKLYNASNAALVCLDAKTGEILAMVGSKDYFDKSIDGQVNVTLMPRQPGSSFKPIVYAAAFQKGYTPQTMLFDVKTNFSTNQKPYIPENYDGKERGPVSIKQALAGSLNIPSVKVLYLTGLKNVLSLAQKMGYSTLKNPQQYGLSLVLGGGEVKLLEHTAAYSIFAQEGMKHKIKAILEIKDSQGKIIEKKEKDKGERVLDRQTARLINDILSDNQARSFIFGTKSYLYLGDIPVAAKTGTTNDFRDGWTIGYTPSIVTGVWVGNNDNSKMKKGACGLNVAAPIWHQFMEKILKNKEKENFTPPEKEKVEKPILNGQWKVKIKVKIDKISGKLATKDTPPSCIEERTYEEVHNILHYLDKDNPRGPIPEHPEKDPQYKNWEQPVQEWIRKNHIVLKLPPKEKDNVHLKIYKPTLKVIEPENGSIITNPFLKIVGNASGLRKIKRIEYYIDEKLAAYSYQPYFQKTINLDNLKNGLHTLKVVAYDSVENNNSTEIHFFYNSNNYQTNQPTIFWITPSNNSSFFLQETPITLAFSINSPLKVQKVKFYYIFENDSKNHLIGMITQPESLSNIKIIWANIPKKGKYQLYAQIIDKDNNTYTTKEVTVFIK